MKIAAPLVTLLLLLAACDGEPPEVSGDPLAPGATAGIALGGSLDANRYSMLEVRGFPATSDVLEGDVFRQIPTDRGLVRAESLDVDGLAFPLDLTIGADGIGATSLPCYRIVAWLATAPGSAGPSEGAPWGTAAVELNRCGGFGYCGLAADAASITLASQP